MAGRRRRRRARCGRTGRPSRRGCCSGRPDSADGPSGRRQQLGQRDRRVPRAERARLGPGRRRRAGDPRIRISATGCSTSRRTCRRASRGSTCTPPTRGPSPSAPAGRPAHRRQRRQHGRRGRGAARARPRRARRVLMLAPGSGLGCAFVDEQGAAARRRHPRGHGGGAHARAAAPARRQAVPLRLRPDLGLRRGLHDAVRTALPARRTPGRRSPPAPS